MVLSPSGATQNLAREPFILVWPRPVFLSWTLRRHAEPRPPCAAPPGLSSLGMPTHPSGSRLSPLRLQGGL